MCKLFSQRMHETGNRQEAGITQPLRNMQRWVWRHTQPQQFFGGNLGIRDGPTMQKLSGWCHRQSSSKRFRWIKLARPKLHYWNYQAATKGTWHLWNFSHVQISPRVLTRWAHRLSRRHSAGCITRNPGTRPPPDLTPWLRYPDFKGQNSLCVRIPKSITELAPLLTSNHRLPFVDICAQIPSHF